MSGNSHADTIRRYIHDTHAPSSTRALIAAEALDALLAENQRLRKERDYYKRRWIVHGIRWPTWLSFDRKKYVAAVMGALAGDGE